MSESQTGAGNLKTWKTWKLENFENINNNDPWDMLNNFIAKNCNAFLGPQQHHHPLLWVCQSYSWFPAKNKGNFTLTTFKVIRVKVVLFFIFFYTLWTARYSRWRNPPFPGFLGLNRHLEGDLDRALLLVSSHTLPFSPQWVVDSED